MIGIGIAIVPIIIYYKVSIKPKLQIRYNENQGLEQQKEILQTTINNQLAQTHNLDQEISVKSIELQQINFNIQKQSNTLSELNISVTTLETERKLLIEHLDQIEANAQQVSNAIYEKCMNNMQNSLEAQAIKLSAEYQEASLDYEEAYSQVMRELAADLQNLIKEKKEQLRELCLELAELTAKRNSAVEANKRAKQIEEQQDFYRIVISKQDSEEIIKLHSVIPYLRDPVALYKVIWKVYYENPTSDMIGRVVGSTIKTGIYKITNLKNQMCYVGQARDIAARWRQHIKRGLGAEAPTRNKLYPAMFEEGIENFTFELVEECDVSLLDSREDYWQDFYHAKDYGYSIK